MIDRYTTEPELPEEEPRNNLPLIIALLAILGGLVLLSVFAYLLLTGSSGGNANDPAPDTPIVTANSTPTPFAGIINNPIDTFEDPISVQVGSSEPISLPVSAPSALTLGEQTFSVQREAIGETGIWSPLLNAPDSAKWVRGTIVNYVIAIQDSEENRDLIQSLELGEELSLETTDGAVRRFTFDERAVVPITNRDVFSQRFPGVTVVLVGLGDESPDRLVVRARYIFDDSAESLPPSSSASTNASSSRVQWGEFGQLGTLQLAVTLLDPRPQTNSSFTNYLLDYQIENQSGAPLNTNTLEFLLLDSVGNTYPVNPITSNLGNQPPLPASLNAGQTTSATVGYQIPAGLEKDALSLLIRKTDTSETLQVQLTDPVAQTSKNSELIISLSAAEVTQDGGGLLIQGQAFNQGTSTIAIEPSDITVSSDGSVYLIQSTNPAFPYIVNSGETTNFSLTVQRPVGSTATVRILDQEWQLTGLR